MLTSLFVRGTGQSAPAELWFIAIILKISFRIFVNFFFFNFPGGFFGAEWDFGAVGFTSIASLAAQPSTSITPQPFEATPVSVPPILFQKNDHSCCRN